MYGVNQGSLKQSVDDQFVMAVLAVVTRLSYSCLCPYSYDFNSFRKLFVQRYVAAGAHYSMGAVQRPSLFSVNFYNQCDILVKKISLLALL